MADASILATGVAVRDHSYPQIFVNIVKFCPLRPHPTINESPRVGHIQAGVIQGLDKIPDKNNNAIPDTGTVVCHDILSLSCPCHIMYTIPCLNFENIYLKHYYD